MSRPHGFHHTDETKRKLSIANKGKFYQEKKFGKENPNWRGDKVGYTALHGWVKRRFPKTPCENCGAKSNVDLANISQKYLRKLDDWEWLCRRCHMKKDGRMDLLAPKRKVVCYLDNETVIKTWDMASIAAQEFGIDLSSIIKCCKGKKKAAGRLRWKYA